MLRKSFELPPEAARAFLKDMRAFHKAEDQLAGDEIAATAVWRLKQHLPKGFRLRLADVKELFHLWKQQT